jgi:hypothetical protein
VVDQLALAFPEPVQTAGERFMAFVDFSGRKFTMLGERVGQVFGEHEPPEAKYFAPVGFHLISRDRAGPCLEVRSFTEFIPFLPDHQIGLLEHVVHAIDTRHQGNDVGPQHRLIAGDLTDKCSLLCSVEGHSDLVTSVRGKAAED